MVAEWEMLATSAATTIVRLMATDAWEQAHVLLTDVWRRNLPNQTGSLEADLDSADQIVAMARRSGSAGVEDVIRGDWRHRFAELLVSTPGARADLEDAMRQLTALSAQQSNRTAHS